MRNKFDHLIDTYLDKKIGIDTGFLSEALSHGLQENINLLENNNLMIEAGIGNDSTADASQKIRSNKLYWMDKSHDNKFEKEFLNLAENFIDRLNETCYAGINSYEFQYALYEEGSYYKRHRDQFKSDDNRKYSLTTYLNENWLADEGGELWLYPAEGIQKILPQSQTTVFFKSDEMEHEVTPTRRRRMSISGWLKVI